MRNDKFKTMLEDEKNSLALDQHQELQELLIQLLSFVVDVCEKNNIPYFLSEGSCLGAVRHQGIIPWDDDIDIVIPISTLPIFEAAVAREKNERYRVERAFVPGGNEWCRVIDSEVELTGGLFEWANTAHPTIDVDLLMGMPNNSFLRTLYYYRLRLQLKIWKFSTPRTIDDAVRK